MDVTPGQQKLLAYWGVIQQQVAQRANTSDLWRNVRAAAEAEGANLKGATAVDMGRLRSIAASQQAAMRNFQQSRINAVITGDMIGRDVSSRSLSDQSLAPSWIVRFEHDVTIDGQLKTLWRSSTVDFRLPHTTGELRQLVEGDALGLAEDYGVTHIGVGRIQIVAV